ncbi:Alpha crystallin/Hsp20 domain [Dillenia turbinata]|uniref:Alpha crystallin/Hsp20 domain n=1 Tax=Dillenia turbinata TaxID=194707 RepID=A0AAN8W6L4_9MAGN
MDAKAGAALPHEYHDFEPYCRWEREDERETLVMHLPEFRKENLKVVINNAGLLRITGQRHVAEGRWSRFKKEIEVPKHCKEDEIKAKFMGDFLYITMPKKVTLSTTNDHKTIRKMPTEFNQSRVQTEEKPTRDDAVNQVTGKDAFQEPVVAGTTTAMATIPKEPTRDDVVNQVTGKGTLQEPVVAGTTTAMASGLPSVMVSRRALVFAAGVTVAAVVFVLGCLVAYGIYGRSNDGN